MRNKKITTHHISSGGPSFFVSIGVGGFAEQVVDGSVVKAGEFDEDGHRNFRSSNFVLAVTGLRDAKLRSNGSLFQVSVFSEVTDTRVWNDVTHCFHLENIIS